MPNWASGSMRIIGKYEDVKNFLLNGTQIVGEKTDSGCQLDEFDDYINVKTVKSEAYIKETNRHFFQLDECIFTKEEAINNEIVEILLWLYAAWSVQADNLAEISKKYNLKMEVEAEEQGCCFGQKITIKNGKIIENDTFYLDEEDECWG